MKIAVLKESEPGERRVAATPETVKTFVALVASVAVETGARAAATLSDADYCHADHGTRLELHSDHASIRHWSGA